eukprot:TRINITY_DN2481_c0_g1_i1.p1 TRINITY_DN2481_c0_g1~~TRINITY_DN2481_c0_g1_i1.p1  ORF type:complete len:943 (+),score=220.16 TRINITY_DN2481_c0_g1_i1:240-3068(+)
MEASVPGRLKEWEIHGFFTMKDLDMNAISKEAAHRWLRPNEIYAILCNYEHFHVNVKPVDMPASGTLLLFDRKALRNFRKDGHSWQKKKDGKTVKEAHEHLKVGNEERIHVYYARGEDNPKFVRRSYWLLNRAYEHIVLVHYREVSEVNPKSNSSPQEVFSISFLSERNHRPSVFPSSSSSGGPSAADVDIQSYADPWHEGKNSADWTIHQISTLEWDDLLEPQGTSYHTCNLNSPLDNGRAYMGTSSKSTMMPNISSVDTSGDGFAPTGLLCMNDTNQKNNQWAENQEMANYSFESQNVNDNFGKAFGNPSLSVASGIIRKQTSFKKQDSFGRWLSSVLDDSPVSSDVRHNLDYTQSVKGMESGAAINHSSGQDSHFHIVEISPSWGLSSEETKVIITGFWVGGQNTEMQAKWYCVFGTEIVPAETVQPGVFRSMAPPRAAGTVALYLTCDGRSPCSQISSFEYCSLGNKISRTCLTPDETIQEIFILQTRLAHLLFSSYKGSVFLNGNHSAEALITANKVGSLFFNTEHDWLSLLKAASEGSKPNEEAMYSLIELILQKKLKEWVLEKAVDKSGAEVLDTKGQGVLHLIAALGYSWAIFPILSAGINLDFRDRHGWTAMHWAAFYGREQTVAMLLAAGADASLVTDPTKDAPEGCTPSDVAYKKGYKGLAGYLAEKALTTHLSKLTLYAKNDPRRNIRTEEFEKTKEMSEDELSLKESLTALRVATETAAKIRAAYREHSFRLRVASVQGNGWAENEDEAVKMLAALKIQKAFRLYCVKKQVNAAKCIQHKFRGWKIRREFVNLRKQVIKIQAYFRGHQARKHYRKILWSVGVLEKAVLRWRQKKKGLRGLQVKGNVSVEALEPGVDSDPMEDFFRMGRKQAEERMERSVIRVQSMYRSYQARKEYKAMKENYMRAQLQFQQVMNAENSQAADSMIGYFP